jgi:hypothetical protein
MPSPNGTNYAKLFINVPGLAYDSKHGLARDDYEAPQDDIKSGLSDLLEFLKKCMKPDDYGKAEIAVSKLMELSGQRVDDHNAALNEARSDVTEDDPPAFPGRPTKGGEPLPAKAMDSLSARLRSASRASDEGRRNLLRHMARIGVM